MKLEKGHYTYQNTSSTFQEVNYWSYPVDGTFLLNLKC